MRFLAVILLALACAADDNFKETERASSGPGVAPTIKMPENLRLKISLTEALNIGIGVDIVCLLSLVLTIVWD